VAQSFLILYYIASGYDRNTIIRRETKDGDIIHGEIHQQ
jgi:hypothetical protein